MPTRPTVCDRCGAPLTWRKPARGGAIRCDRELVRFVEGRAGREAFWVEATQRWTKGTADPRGLVQGYRVHRCDPVTSKDTRRARGDRAPPLPPDEGAQARSDAAKLRRALGRASALARDTLEALEPQGIPEGLRRRLEGLASYETETEHPKTQAQRHKGTRAQRQVDESRGVHRPRRPPPRADPRGRRS